MNNTCGVLYVLPRCTWVPSEVSDFLPPTKKMSVGRLATLNCPRCKGVCAASHPEYIPVLGLVFLGKASDKW